MQCGFAWNTFCDITQYSLRRSILIEVQITKTSGRYLGHSGGIVSMPNLESEDKPTPDVSKVPWTADRAPIDPTDPFLVKRTTPSSVPRARVDSFGNIHFAQEGTLGQFEIIDSNNDGYLSRQEVRDQNERMIRQNPESRESRLPSFFADRHFDALKQVRNDEWGDETEISREDLKASFFQLKRSDAAVLRANDSLFGTSSDSPAQRLDLVLSNQRTVDDMFPKMDTNSDQYVSKDELRDFALKQTSPADFALLLHLHSRFDGIVRLSDDETLIETQLTRDDLEQYFWRKKAALMTQYAQDHFNELADGNGFVTEQKLAAFKETRPATEAPLIDLLASHVYDIAAVSNDERFSESTGFTRKDLDKYATLPYRSGYMYRERCEFGSSGFSANLDETVNGTFLHGINEIGF
jgi:Ca2+-binding EF-hand superfamily protein